MICTKTIYTICKSVYQTCSCAFNLIKILEPTPAHPTSQMSVAQINESFVRYNNNNNNMSVLPYRRFSLFACATYVNPNFAHKE